MRHVVFALVLLFYVLAISQNWGYYSGAMMVALYIRNGGRWMAPVSSVPIELSGWWTDDSRHHPSIRP